jgi:hypothetical protein
MHTSQEANVPNLAKDKLKAWFRNIHATSLTRKEERLYKERVDHKLLIFW